MEIATVSDKRFCGFAYFISGLALMRRVPAMGTVRAFGATFSVLEEHFAVPCRVGLGLCCPGCGWMIEKQCIRE